MTYVLVCTRGPKKGSRWALTSKGVKIGRANSCEIQVADISAELFHCIVKLVDGKPVVQNMASDTGVDVNGARVGEAQLKPMDSIRVGHAKFVLLASGGRRRGLGARIVAAIALLSVFIVLAFVFLRQKQPKADVSATPAKEVVATNSAVQVVEVVTTNRVITIVDSVTITNHVEMSQEQADELPEISNPPRETPDDAPVAVPDPGNQEEPEPPYDYNLTNTVKEVKEIVYDPNQPFQVITSEQALSIGGASGGDEVRVVFNSDGTRDIIHLFTEPGKTKALVVPAQNRIHARPGQFLVVAGGGSGGGMHGGGGGGGGVVKNVLKIPVGTAFAYVGEGGSPPWSEANGEDSVLTIGGKTYTAMGGGAGGRLHGDWGMGPDCSDTQGWGRAGGSAGGGALRKPEINGITYSQGKSFQRDSNGVGRGGCAYPGSLHGGPGFESAISGEKRVYSKGGIVRDGALPDGDGEANTGFGGDSRNWGSDPRRHRGSSGIIVVRYTVKQSHSRVEVPRVAAERPEPDKEVKTEVIDDVAWRYFLEGGSAVIGCHGAKSLNQPDLWVPAVDVTALNGTVRIPDRIGGRPVRKIGKGAFQGCSKVTKFIVPEGVTDCEARAFAKCTQLKAVVYPSTLKRLGESQVQGSGEVEVLRFLSVPPVSDEMRCPFKGIWIGTKVSVPVALSYAWRNYGRERSWHMCKHGCHINSCRTIPSAEEMRIAKKMSSGFVGTEVLCAVNADNIGACQKLLLEQVEGLWRKASTGAAEIDVLPRKLYSQDSFSPNTAAIYVSMMFFRARENVRFGTLTTGYSMVLVDDNVVIGLAKSESQDDNLRQSSSPVSFKNEGWHRIALIVANASAMDCGGGVFYSRGDNNVWERFEASKNGKDFSVDRLKARRVLKDIERAKQITR